MATRSDVIVDFNPSPRVAEVAAPSTEIVVQDVVDTLRPAEESFRGMSEQKLLDASGKEPLGGGVQVGITTALQNTLIAFEGRTSPAETGTVTSVPTSPIAGTQRFADSAADFTTANVQRGSLVINFTDMSIADVTQVIDSTTLETKTLVNGTTNTYTTLDDYQVFNIEQVLVSGGNLTAVDDAGSPLATGVLPTAFTQVVVQASSSATINEADAQATALAVWGMSTTNAQATASGTMGERIAKKLLSVVTFLGLK